MNDRDHFCHSCNREVYAHGLNAYGECGPCEQQRDEQDKYDGCYACKICSTWWSTPEKLAAHERTNHGRDPWAELTPENKARVEAMTGIMDAPSDEDMEYLYKSLGVPNPNN